MMPAASVMRGFRAERLREQFVAGEGVAQAFGPQTWTLVSAAANSRMRWRQPPHGVHRTIAAADHRDLADLLRTVQHHGGNGAGLGTVAVG
jgi:hypothetical protein